MAKHSARRVDKVERFILGLNEQSGVNFHVRRTTDQHLRIVARHITPGPGVRTTAMYSSAESDGRAGTNCRADLRAIGIDLPINI